MKTSELIDKIGKEKLLIYKDEDTKKVTYIRVFTEEVLSRKSKYVAEIGCFRDWLILRNGCPKELAMILIDYNYTPLEEREEEKLYCLKMPNGFNHLLGENYVCLANEKDDRYVISSKFSDFIYKAKFTQKEIDDMPFDTNFFIKEEVK